MKKLSSRKKWIIAIVLVIIILVSIFVPKSCSKKDDFSKNHLKKQDTTKNISSNTKVDETLLLKTTIDSLQKALNFCEGEKKPIVKKPTIVKRKTVKKITKPILVVPVVKVVPPKENEEIKLPFNGITIEKNEKKVIPKKSTKKVVTETSKPIIRQDEVDNNCHCIRYGNKIRLNY